METAAWGVGTGTWVDLMRWVNNLFILNQTTLAPNLERLIP
jgi:hypothetical protein